MGGARSVALAASLWLCAACAGPGLSLPEEDIEALPPVAPVIPTEAPTGPAGGRGLYVLEPDAPAQGLRAEPGEERGLASWYGARFHRRRTASGEPFDMHALTAAHPTLPFGTRVCVRSLVTGRAVQVRINDRGPHTGGRIIDLSRAAARQLGMLGRGTKRVAVTALDDDGGDGCPAAGKP